MGNFGRVWGILTVFLAVGPLNWTGGAIWAGTSLLPRQSADQEASALLSEGRGLFLDGSLVEAGQVFRRLVPLLRESGDRRSLASVLNALSFIESSQGNYTEAVSSAREAALIREDLGDSPGRADSLTNLGLALSNLGRYDEASTCYRTALTIYKKDDDLEGVSIERNNIGNVLFFQGRYLDALEEYQEALELVNGHAKESWSQHEKYRTIVNLAALHQKLGAYERALDLYSGLEEGVLSSGEQAQLFSNQGALYRHLGDAVKALRMYQRSQRLFQEERNSDGEIGVAKNIGIALALDLGDLPRALATFQNALDLAVSSGNQREELHCRLYRAETLRLLDRTREAREDLRQARQTAADLGAVEEEWKAIFSLGRLAESEGQASEAEKDYQAAIDLIESVRSRLQLASLTPGFLADKRQVYDALIALLGERFAASDAIDASSFERILQLTEKARSQAFLDQFSSPLESLNARRNPEVAARLREVRAEAAAIWKRLPGSPAANRSSLRSKLADLENEYLRLEREVDRGVSGSRRIPDLKGIQSRLPSGAGLVEFWVGKREWVSMGVDQNGFRLRRTVFPDRSAFGERECVAALSDPSATGWKKRCAALGEALLKDLPPSSSGKKRLVLVPDGFLNSVPFEALSDGADHLLVEDFEIEYLPTAALLEEPPPAKAGLAPRLPWEASMLAFGNPLPKAGGALDRFGQSWPPLPHSAEEVRRIAGILPGQARVRLGEQARKAALENDLPAADYSVIHFATHAAADPVSAERSKILFSSSASDQSYDFLFLGEILGLPLGRPGLVVLSACDTGRGTDRTAGAEDFGRAFLLAGAQSVVATAWKVSDEATAEFMAGFYSRLGRGDAPASALREAKLRFLRSGKTVAHPYYWAAFDLYGDGFSPLRLPLSWATTVAFAVALIGAALSLYLLWKRRRGGRGAERSRA